MVTNPDETVSGPSSATTPLITFTSTTTGAAAEIWVRTSAAGLVASHGGVATVDNYKILTVGFTWSRR